MKPLVLTNKIALTLTHALQGALTRARILMFVPMIQSHLKDLQNIHLLSDVGQGCPDRLWHVVISVTLNEEQAIEKQFVQCVLVAEKESVEKGNLDDTRPSLGSDNFEFLQVREPSEAQHFVHNLLRISKGRSWLSLPYSRVYRILVDATSAGIDGTTPL